MMQQSDEFISSPDVTEKSRYRQHRPHKSQQRDRSGLRSCIRFCFEKQKPTERREAAMNPQPGPAATSAADGGLRELTSTWFIQTQAPLVSHNGLFPTWFRGFISRRDAEDILKDKNLGSFLIRLSDKALGYILSYRGRDRCRHFVINQSALGQFVVVGDNIGHSTISELIEYFKENPIKPFGEYLSTSCFGDQREDLYDTIQVSPRERPVATVHALKARKQQSNLGSDHPLPGNRPKNRAEEVPALPRRSRLLENASNSETSDLVCYAQVRTKKFRERQLKGAAPDNSSRPPSVYSELDQLDSRSRSMPHLLSSNEEPSYRLSVTPPLPSRDTSSPDLSNRGACSTPSPEPSPGRPHSVLGQNQLISQQSPDPGIGAEDGGVYAEVPMEHCRRAEDTYEQLQVESNPYEPVGLLRAKPEPSTRMAKNDKWKRLFPDVKKKW